MKLRWPKNIGNSSYGPMEREVYILVIVLSKAGQNKKVSYEPYAN
jgi:hypothetical protein